MGKPAVAPILTVSAGNNEVALSWNSVTGAHEYQVFRTEGALGCVQGKALVKSTTETWYTDTGLMNGRDYYYIVIPKGSTASCFGPASSCKQASPVESPSILFTCPQTQIILNRDAGTTSSVHCTLTALGGYTNTANPITVTDCTATLTGVTCNPPTGGFTFSSGGPTQEIVTFSIVVDSSAQLGQNIVEATVSDGTISDSSSIPFQVIEGSGPQVAIYDATLGTVHCSLVGSECSSRDLLDLDGRAGLGPEDNQPNNLDGCTDGTTGSYHSDESIDKIEIINQSNPGSNIRENDTIQIKATVWCWSTGNADKATYYYTTDPNAGTINWIYVGEVPECPGGGQHVLTAS